MTNPRVFKVSSIYLPNWLPNQRKHPQVSAEERKKMKKIIVSRKPELSVMFDQPFSGEQMLTFSQKTKKQFSLHDVIDCIARGYQMMFRESQEWKKNSIRLVDTDDYDFLDMYLEKITYDPHENRITFEYDT